MHFPDDAGRALVQTLRPGDVVVLDNIVQRHHGARLEMALRGHTVIALEATERQKSYLELAPVIERLIEGGVRKQHRLVAIGGGIIQDVVAFVASILYRGIEWVFVPTTLLAQADSCIGAKTSINFGPYKNQLGGFYPPSTILVDVSFLQTLPERERRSGLGEMAHYFLVAGEDEFQVFKDDSVRALTDDAVLRDLIFRSLAIKRGFIEIDEFDRNERQVLNYGHTFGHALESVTEYVIPHGIAVCYGMDIANFVSYQFGYIDAATRDLVRSVLSPIWDGFPIPSFEQPVYEDALRRDKKNRGNELGLILTRGIGEMFKDYQPLDDRFSSWLTTYFAEAAGAKP